MLRRLLLALCFALAAPLAFAQQQRPADPQGWRALAISDLDAARDLLRDQTPVPFDRENPAYAAWLNDGYAAARAAAEHVRDETGYFYTLARYINGFNDPHFSLSPTGPLPPARWPGFVAAARNGGAVVAMRDEGDPDAPPLDAQILSCDGESLAALAEARIFPFVLNPRLALDRRRAVTRLFLDRAVPGAPAPRRCVIAANGEQRELELRWRALPELEDAYWTAFQTASSGPRAQWGVAEIEPGVFWIGVPTFESGEETAPLLEHLLASVNQHGDAMRAGRAIVIDVRGNGGGNSGWADRLAESIFTPRIAGRANRNRTPSAVDWRASPENIAYWQAWLTNVGRAEFGENSREARFGGDIVRGMQRALGRDPPLWRDGPDDVPAAGGMTQARPRGPSPFPARVYLLSNGSCGSSCLNFADTVLFVPGVQLIGSATSGDGVYMDVRVVDLPSGLARLTFPQKVRRGGGRAALEAYAPDLAYDGAWDDASVRAWVMELIEAQ